MYYYVFRRDTRYGYYDYIQDFDNMIITEDPVRAAQVSRSELNYIDLDYLLSLGFHPVEITAVGLRFLAGALFRPVTRGYRPRVAPPKPRRLPVPPPPPKPRPGRIPAGRAAAGRPVSGIGRATQHPADAPAFLQAARPCPAERPKRREARSRSAHADAGSSEFFAQAPERRRGLFLLLDLSGQAERAMKA